MAGEGSWKVSRLANVTNELDRERTKKAGEQGSGEGDGYMHEARAKAGKRVPHNQSMSQEGGRKKKAWELRG